MEIGARMVTRTEGGAFRSTTIFSQNVVTSTSEMPKCRGIYISLARPTVLSKMLKKIEGNETVTSKNAETSTPVWTHIRDAGRRMCHAKGRASKGASDGYCRLPATKRINCHGGAR